MERRAVAPSRSDRGGVRSCRGAGCDGALAPPGADRQRALVAYGRERRRRLSVPVSDAIREHLEWLMEHEFRLYRWVEARFEQQASACEGRG